MGHVTDATFNPNAHEFTELLGRLKSLIRDAEQHASNLSHTNDPRANELSDIENMLMDARRAVHKLQ